MAGASLIQGLTLAHVVDSAGAGFSSVLTTDFKVWQGVVGPSPAAGFHAGVIIGKTLPLIFLPGVFPLKNFQNKTLPGVSEINFFNQMWNPPPSWENPPH